MPSLPLISGRIIFPHFLVSYISIRALHTGKSAFLLAPDTFSRAAAIYGPTTGTLLTNPAIVAKKSPNRTRIPYSSIRKPKKGHRRRMRAMPAVKAAVPFHFCRRAKKAAVFCTPIMRVSPIRKRIWMRRRVRKELCMHRRGVM